MNVEIQAPEVNNTWTFAPLPHGKKAIVCKCVYKIKYKYDGSIERYKVRLVAKGYTQVEGMNYKETFALILKLITLCCLLIVATTHKNKHRTIGSQNSLLLFKKHGFINPMQIIRYSQWYVKVHLLQC